MWWSPVDGQDDAGRSGLSVVKLAARGDAWPGVLVELPDPPHGPGARDRNAHPVPPLPVLLMNDREFVAEDLPRLVFAVVDHGFLQGDEVGSEIAEPFDKHRPPGIPARAGSPNVQGHNPHMEFLVQPRCRSFIRA